MKDCVLDSFPGQYLSSILVLQQDQQDKIKCFYSFSLAGIDLGGNCAHLSPEILNARRGPRKFVSYVKQPVWAAGVLAYEFAGHRSPFESGVTTIDQRGYDVNELPPLKYTYCRNSMHCQPLPSEFTALVNLMLEMEPNDRPSLRSCLTRIQLLYYAPNLDVD